MSWSFHKGPIVKPWLLCRLGIHKWLDVTHSRRKVKRTGPARYFNFSYIDNNYRGCERCGRIEATSTRMMFSGKKWIKWGFTNPDYLKDNLTLANIVDLTAFQLSDIMTQEIFDVLMAYVTQTLNELHNENWQLGDKVVKYWDHYYNFGPYNIGLPHVEILDGQDRPPGGYIIIQLKSNPMRLNVTLSEIVDHATLENKIKSYIGSSGANVALAQ